MSDELINFLKVQNGNLSRLTVGDASSHMLAIQKFIEGYLAQYSLTINGSKNLNSVELEANKILNFLFMMTNILAESNSANYLYDAVVVSRSQLAGIEEKFNELVNLVNEEIETASIKINSSGLSVKEMLKKLSN